MQSRIEPAAGHLAAAMRRKPPKQLLCHASILLLIPSQTAIGDFIVGFGDAVLLIRCQRMPCGLKSADNLAPAMLRKPLDQLPHHMSVGNSVVLLIPRFFDSTIPLDNAKWNRQLAIWLLP